MDPSYIDTSKPFDVTYVKDINTRMQIPDRLTFETSSDSLYGDSGSDFDMMLPDKLVLGGDKRLPTRLYRPTGDNLSGHHTPVHIPSPPSSITFDVMSFPDVGVSSDSVLSTNYDKNSVSPSHFDTGADQSFKKSNQGYHSKPLMDKTNQYELDDETTLTTHLYDGSSAFETQMRVLSERIALLERVETARRDRDRLVMMSSLSALGFSLLALWFTTGRRR